MHEAHANMLEVEMQLQRIDDADFMETILPDHYKCKEREHGVHCYSSEGIEERDEEHWHYIMVAIKNHFKNRFQEVYHNVCTHHQDFTVYLKAY